MSVISNPVSVALKSPLYADPSESRLFKTLLYFDIFNFPLTLEEVYRFCDFESLSAAQLVLNKWKLHGLISQSGNHYALHAADHKVAKRKKDMFRADCMIAHGLKNASLIQRFPFVRAVFFSGSISKGVVAKDGDVDFFIITRPHRLWLCRTMLALYKKLFLKGSHKFFCINYFIDSNHLSIEEQNRFTATEMTTLVPVCGLPELIQSFYKANAWVRNFYPNHLGRPILSKSKRSTFKFVFELALTCLGAGLFDRFWQRFTTGFWRRKFEDMPDEDFAIALKSRRHVSKHHPQNFQKNVLAAFDQKVEEFEKVHNLKFC